MGSLSQKSSEMRHGSDHASYISIFCYTSLPLTYLLCSSWTRIYERIFTCSWASEASLLLLLAHKYDEDVLDLNANFRLLRESRPSASMKLALMWDLDDSECESYTLASCDTTLRMLPKPFTRLFAPSKSESYLSPLALSTFNTEVIFSSASVASFCKKEKLKDQDINSCISYFSKGSDPCDPKALLGKLPALRR